MLLRAGRKVGGVMQSESTIKMRIKKTDVTGAKTKIEAVAKFQRQKKIERFLAALTIILIIAAWATGYRMQSADIEGSLLQAVPAAERIEKVRHGSYAAWKGDKLIAYIAVGEGSGYGGPMDIAVAVDPTGKISGMSVVNHRETPSWYKRVIENAFVSRVIGKSYSDTLRLGDDVDAVSGATYTSRGIVDAARNASRHIAATQLNQAVPPKEAEKIIFGLPEILLLALFILAIASQRVTFLKKKKLRWALMLTSMVMLGFVYTNLLTISLINKMLLGFWPDWHTHLYWYLLICGVLLTLIVSGKNSYCETFCPFGVAQECLGQVGGAKGVPIPRYQTLFKWMQRTLALAAVLIALIYRNPGISSYEIFGTLFDLKGNISQFFLLGLVILTSLFVFRPWCRYLCPIHPFEDFIKFLRNQVKGIWPQKQKTNSKNA